MSKMMTVADVKNEILNGKIEYIGQAVMDNDAQGGVHYTQDAITQDGTKVTLFWRMTPECEQWEIDACEYLKLLSLRNQGGQSDSYRIDGAVADKIDNDDATALTDVMIMYELDKDDAQKIIDIYTRYGGNPIDYAYYVNDESNHCNWVDPYKIDIHE